jgi:hypothetical protein
MHSQHQQLHGLTNVWLMCESVQAKTDLCRGLKTSKAKRLMGMMSNKAQSLMAATSWFIANDNHLAHVPRPGSIHLPSGMQQRSHWLPTAVWACPEAAPQHQAQSTDLGIVGRSEI